MHNLQVVLASRPQGPVTEKNFRFVESKDPRFKTGDIVGGRSGWQLSFIGMLKGLNLGKQLVKLA